MSEAVSEQLERIALADLQTGESIRVVTGEGEDSFTYNFTIEKAGRWPIGQMIETTPSGEVVGEGSFMLQGCGIWTNRRQNPVQIQELAFTSYFSDLSLGSFMVGSHPNTPLGRMVFDKPGQQITSLQIL